MSETVTYLSRRCPRCGRQLPPDAPEGLCASCLLTAGAETLTGASEPSATGDTSLPGAPRLVDGQGWGPYRVIRLLGRGGMGEVYEAEQLETGRRLALKVLRHTLGGADDRARFLREGQLAASISHAHTVYIFGSEEVGGAPAITMELLSGGTLKDRVSAEGPMSPSAAVSAVLDVIGGLDAAQAAGILHRDIKPSNCFVDADGAVKVGDFGLSISTLTRDVQHELETTGFEGTPQFAAPEQLRGEPLDLRADIYAVGATLYYLLTGRPPLDTPDFRELVARVASETPQSPRALRRDIPRGLAGVVLRCLAKVPAGRPQSYAELADLLRPYASADEVPAPLGARFIAWIADSVIFAIMTWLLSVSAWTVATLGSATTLLQLASWSWLTGAIYYFVLEGCWGASLGKRLMGLRVSSRAGSGWWPRIGLRTALFHTPQLIHTLLMLAATGGLLAPSVGYTANAARSGWHWNLPPYALVSSLLTVLLWLLTILLFSTARRGNGWTGVHELLSRTRVVQRNVRAVAPAAPKASPTDLGPALSSWRRVGPYAVHTTVGETGAGRLFVGIDPILRRHVWIHEVPPASPPVQPARRDTSRPGRLYWLAGRRSATENWDAFEAPRGEPLLCGPSTSGWPEVHRSLTSLAIELDASVREGTDLQPVLAQVWKNADGHLVLLDFPWPGLTGSDADEHLSPVALLAAVSARALGPAAPVAPLSGTTLLNRLASESPPPLADVKTELVRLASTPNRPSRVRRVVPIVMAALPVAALVLIVSVMLPLFARSLQGDTVFRQRGEFTRWMMWIADSSADAEFKTREQRTAAEQYIAAHFRSQLTSDEFWNTQAPQIEPFLSWRRTAAEIAARYPAVSPDELARASAIVAPQIQELAAETAGFSANFPAGGEQLRGFVASGFASIPVLFSIVCGLISVLAVPGGVVTRALQHAVVRRDGSEIGRIRSAVRFLVAWSPALAWIACVGVPMFGEPRVSPDVAFVVGSLAFLLMAAGVAWTTAVPGRGPHDRIAGTWVVPR
jgi:hypothetical protein